MIGPGRDCRRWIRAYANEEITRDGSGFMSDIIIVMRENIILLLLGLIRDGVCLYPKVLAIKW